MKPSEIEPKETADAVAHALQALGFEPDADTIACVYEGSSSSNAVAMLAATPIGLLRIADTSTSSPHRARLLTVAVIPWREVSVAVAINIERRGRNDGLVTEWHITFTGHAIPEIVTTSDAQEFVAALLRWSEALPPAAA